MPRYFFHVYDGHDYLDENGMELPDVAAARSEAARYAGHLLQSAPEDFWSGIEWRMEVTDERGLILFSLMFAASDSSGSGAAGARADTFPG